MARPRAEYRRLSPGWLQEVIPMPNRLFKRGAFALLAALVIGFSCPYAFAEASANVQGAPEATFALLTPPVASLSSLSVLPTEAELRGKKATFGKPTSIEPVNVLAPNLDPVDRSKNSQVIPPSFASPARDVPVTGTFDYLTPNIASTTVQGTAYAGGVPLDQNGLPVYEDSYYDSSRVALFTPVTGESFYEDGTLGSLSIPAIGLVAKIYEGESLENFAKGVGHYTFTSIWDGNVGMASHNRGGSAYFNKIHTLRTGDRIHLQTKYGLRSYVVTSVEKIPETDFSKLDPQNHNMITLTTCVMNEPAYRWAVQAAYEESI
jgi:sortase A